MREGALPAAPPPDFSVLAAQIFQEVDQLAASHRSELNACVARCLKALQESRFLVSESERSRVCAPTPSQSEDPSKDRDAGADGQRRPELLVDKESCEPQPLPCEQSGYFERMSKASTGTLDRMSSASAPARRHSSRRRRSGSNDLLPPKELLSQPPTWLERVTSSRYWEIGSGALIILNSVFIGWQTQLQARHAEDAVAGGRPFESGDPSGVFAVQVIFTLLFSVELGSRWICDGLVGFFKDDDVWWNALDVGVVSFSLLDFLLNIVVQSDFLGNLSILRVLRAVRVVRVARVIRIMKFFRELRMMIFSILRSMKSLLWVILVLAMTFYLFGITFTHATLTALETPEMWRDPDTSDVREYFGSLDKSVLALFMAMSGGKDWATYYESLRHLPWPYRLLYLLYISFAIFAVVNIVTGVFVDSALQSNSEDKVITAHEELDSKNDYLRAMRDIFNEMDEDNTGSISLVEFENKLADEHVIAYFSAMKLDVSDAKKLFLLLDHDGSGDVDIQEFVSGCYNLQGESRGLDVKLMQYELSYLHTSVTKISETVVAIQACLRDLHSSMSKRAILPGLDAVVCIS